MSENQPDTWFYEVPMTLTIITVVTFVVLACCVVGGALLRELSITLGG